MMDWFLGDDGASCRGWIPAFAGTTGVGIRLHGLRPNAHAIIRVSPGLESPATEELQEMELEIRPNTWEEFPTLKKVNARAQNNFYDEGDIDRFRIIFDPERSLCAFENVGLSWVVRPATSWT